jgi:hypothetical protein
MKKMEELKKEYCLGCYGKLTHASNELDNEEEGGDENALPLSTKFAAGLY